MQWQIINVFKCSSWSIIIPVQHCRSWDVTIADAHIAISMLKRYTEQPYLWYGVIFTMTDHLCSGLEVNFSDHQPLWTKFSNITVHSPFSLATILFLGKYMLYAYIWVDILKWLDLDVVCYVYMPPHLFHFCVLCMAWLNVHEQMGHGFILFFCNHFFLFHMTFQSSKLCIY